jgi:hypothetical protein
MLASSVFFLAQAVFAADGTLPQDQAASPAPQARPFDVAAFYFPGYHPNPRNDARLGKGWTEWDLLKAARPRFPGHEQPLVPLWGPEDESLPKVMEKKIAAAADHGITAFIFDWYWHEEGPFLDGALDRGFLGAENSNRLKFCVMWANHDWLDIFPAKAGVPQKCLYPGAVNRATFDRATDHVIRTYFSRPNHWTIDGRPVFSIYELMTLVKGLGGLEKTREALDDFRARVRAAGFPGLHLNAVAWGLQPADLVRTLAVDSVTSYCWIHHTPPASFPSTPYADWALAASALWPKFRREWPVPYAPNVSVGWDSSPRTTQTDPFRDVGYPFTSVFVGSTPEEFRKALARAKIFLEEDTISGWKRLEAVKAVFGTAGPAKAPADPKTGSKTDSKAKSGAERP